MMTIIARLFSRFHFTAVTTAIFLLATISPVNAIEKTLAAKALENSYQARIQSYYSVNGFYNFSANLGDKRQLATINDSIIKIDNLMTTLKAELIEPSTAEATKSALVAWKKYRTVLDQNINEVNKTGYPDLRLAGDMATYNINFNQALVDLDTSITSDDENKPEEVITVSRESAETLALMMTKYSARSTSSTSQFYSDGNSDITIDFLAKDLSGLLSKLNGLAKGNQKALNLLNLAETKWNFIRPSYLNYNENRVNFIVNLYSKKVISDLESASAEF